MIWKKCQVSLQKCEHGFYEFSKDVLNSHKRFNSPSWIFLQCFLRIVEDCPQLVILALLVVILYEPQGHLCITKIHDRWIANNGIWSESDIDVLRAPMDLSKSTTNLFFEKQNRKIALSCFVSIFNIILFTALGANKALKLRIQHLRRDYFLTAVSLLIFNKTTY